MQGYREILIVIGEGGRVACVSILSVAGGLSQMPILNAAEFRHQTVLIWLALLFSLHFTTFLELHLLLLQPGQVTAVCRIPENIISIRCVHTINIISIF